MTKTQNPAEHTDQIDVYAVGWLKALQFARRAPRGKYSRLHKLRQELRNNLRQARAGNWRAVKNTFNGYLAEHRSMGTRCGTGWTKRRALADLYRHLADYAAGRGA